MTIHEAVSSKNQTEIIDLVKNNRIILETSLVVNENGEFYTPLCLAVKNGDIETISLLLKLGANVNNLGGWQGMPLHYAVWASNIDRIPIIELLLENGADINARNSKGSTPLHIAVLNGRIKEVEFLVQKGADINIESNNEETPLSIAENPLFRLDGHQAIASFLKKKNLESAPEWDSSKLRAKK